MKITPRYDILITGNHAPAGVSVETPDAIARQLIAEGLAVRSEIKAEVAPAIETATAAPAPETAAAPANRRKK